ncbi:DUF4349 domain-containing protein [Fuchsiella alkaliacetigena]|uniref:DUF4349 domain-containing protein n=1 Tax=Fuchsiella alkaliacetigena TaxID=957042 RepID=UPI00200ADE43|nr:DUF4349 domain-containing protein [Fuchsiella alkaliacetigena]MCK8825305.1 DUF4349 domain-containing protein [Fuchsiella alkaliacetigena]
MNRNKLIKKYFLIALLLGLLFLTACQDSAVDTVSYQRDISRTEQIEAPVGRGDFTKDSITAQTLENVERKIIRRASLRLERRDWEDISREINTLVEAYEGYISNSRQWQDHNNRKFLNYTLQIPQDKFSSALEDLKELGELKDKQINSQDITEEYLDLEMRLENFKHQEKRYQELLEKAESVEDILKIENELNRVRREIESIEGRMRYYDTKVELSTIDLHISQPAAIAGPGLGFADSFKEAVSNFISSINNIIIFIGAIVPWFGLLSLVIFLLYKLIKSRKN